MAVYEKSAEYRKLGNSVIRDHEDLHWIREQKIRIGYVSSDNEKKLAGGRLVFAECKKVPDLYQAFIPYDFLIVVYYPNALLFDEDQMEILMYHELLHVGVDASGKLYVVPHDIEDFYKIINQYGMGWARTGGVTDVMGGEC